MGHAHEHPHNSTYYLDQLCTIATCGALGGVAILMYWLPDSDGKTKLQYILAPQFFLPVLLGGIALLVLIAIRAITLWQEAGSAKTHGHEHHHHHDHEHDHAHGHEHSHAHHHHHAHDHGHDHAHHHHHAHNHGHDHGHAHTHDHGHDHDGHDHGWTPVRYIVLMLPIVIYFLGWPNGTFSADWAARVTSKVALEAPSGTIPDRGVDYNLGFKELANAAYYPDLRQEFEGKKGRIKGMFSPIDQKQFTLLRLKMNCCAADVIPVQVRIICEENVTRFKPQDWVEVEGQIQFRKLVGRNSYMAVLVLESADQVQPTAPLPDYALDG